MKLLGTEHRGTEAQREEEDQGDGGMFALSRKVIGCVIEVHRALGPGLLESAYEHALARELGLQGLPFQRQIDLPVMYKGERLPHCYRLDMVVDTRLLLELKAVEALLPLHKAQTLTYLRMSGLKTALLINFNVEAAKQGIRRISL
ncbi:GxxExxY protein [Ramlibacter sp. Leaf400]|uniref:GxxExxY protein n=1 Tax=Ramlibacter sp. Leaf400 TaxID=1736365 RepID=UPI000A9446A9|nr:GxxExxY protein [Ramlibacter sp. Leaf400]